MPLSPSDQNRLHNTAIADGRNGRIEGLPADKVVFSTYQDKAIWGEDVTALFSQFGNQHPGGTYIDIGANIGLTLIPQAKSGLFRHLIAIEADPLNAELLTRNIAHNDCPPVTIINQAISDKTGTISFERAPDNFGDHRLHKDTPSASNDLMAEATRDLITAPTAPLDELLGDIDSLPRPLCIKSDIQGAEPLLFRGGKHVLAQASLMLIEYWPYGMTRLGEDIAAFQQELASHFSQGAFIWPHEPTAPPQWQPLPPLFAEADRIFESGDTMLHKVGCLNIALRP
ncbi:MAG: FkbM family methyltransferase [Alphaproteobacteria bacterium]